MNETMRKGFSVPLPALLLVAGLAACSQAEIEANFVPASDPWPRWQAHDESSTASIDHSAWDRFLAEYVAADGAGLNRVAYERVSAADKNALLQYIRDLEAVEISRYRRSEQFAYWVNLYNAVTVRTVLETYPVESIRDINDGFLSPGPWDRKLVRVEGEDVSLNDIESRILRPLWRDPRIHYVVNCASVGCPNLDTTAYRAADLDARLDQAARAYINTPRGVRIRDGELVVSSIYAWFKDDFGGTQAAVLGHLNSYADPDLKQTLDRFDSIDGYEYDWALNDAR
ncbi:MAG: DUF547 domain-containing protein [Alphaproteobacteria bacterium]|nr:DUF547 domain-containing protein [Alphaproteobacteria bacterium]